MRSANYRTSDRSHCVRSLPPPHREPLAGLFSPPVFSPFCPDSKLRSRLTIPQARHGLQPFPPVWVLFAHSIRTFLWGTSHPPDPHPLPPCGDIYAPLPAAPSLFAPTFPLTTSASLPLCPLFEAVVENLPTMRGRGGRRSHTHDRHDALELRRLFLQSSSVSSHACDKPDSPFSGTQ